MKTVFLHVGNPKTGTTAIQQYCHAHESVLLRDGLNYSKIGRQHYTINHKAFHFSILKALGEPYRNQPNVQIEDFEVYLDELIGELKQPFPDIHLISFEGLSGLAMYRESERFLRMAQTSLLKDCDIKVIIYVRPPWETLVSNYNQRCKKKNFTPAFLDFVIKSHDVVLDQSFAYDFFVKIFGSHNVIVKMYGEKKGSDFISDFFRSIGVSHETRKESDRALNTSLSKDEIEFSRIRAVLQLELPQSKEDSLLHGDPLLTEDRLNSLITRLDRLNEKNRTFFNDVLGRDVKTYTLSEIIRTEREFNVNALRSYYIEKEGLSGYSK